MIKTGSEVAVTVLFDGAKEGLLLWFHTLIPAILPFLVITKLLLSYQVPQKLAPLLTPVRKLFGLSPAGTFPILIGFLSGYPVAAGVCADLTRQGTLSVKEGQFLMSMTNNASPPYILSFLAGQCLGHPELGIVLFLLIHGSSLLVSFVLRPFFCRGSFPEGRPLPASEELHVSLPERTDRAIMESFEAMAKIGGYVILSSILVAIASRFIPAFFLGCIEITSGSAAIAASSSSLGIKTALITAVTAFGGLSGLAQAKSVTEQSGLSLIPYLMVKLPVSLLSAGAAWLYVTCLL